MKGKTIESNIHTYLKAQRFYFLAEQCFNLIKKSLAPLLKKYGLNHSQYLILMVLRYASIAKNDVISTELSYLLGLEKHSITSLVDSLCNSGYIVRKRSEKDRRAVFLNLTPKGKKLVEKVQPQTVETVAVFPDSSDEEFQFILTFLQQLRLLAARKNKQQPELFQQAYSKLLLEGEEEFRKIYLKERTKA